MTQRHPTAIIYLVPAFIMATKQIIFRGGGESQYFAHVINCILVLLRNIQSGSQRNEIKIENL